MRRIHGYESYRGRSGARTALMVIIALLAVVLLLAVAGYFVLQRYVVYTDDGEARVELPFLKDDEEPEPTPNDDPVVIVTDGPMDPDDPLASAQPQETLEPLYAVSLPRSALTDGSAAAAVAAAGGNAALFDMKGDDGFLAYVSALPEAARLATSGADQRVNDGAQALNAADLYTIARVACFRDNRVPRMDHDMAMRTTGGYNWFDPQDVRWVDPGKPAVRDYLVGVCVELAQLGFDEILLDWSAFPGKGELEIIRRPEGQTLADRTAILESFYAALETALAPFPDVKLSMTADPETLLAPADESARTADQLSRFACRIYAPAGTDGLSQAGIGPDRLVLTSAPAGYSFNAVQPVLPPNAGGVVLPLN